MGPVWILKAPVIQEKGSFSVSHMFLLISFYISSLYHQHLLLQDLAADLAAADFRAFLASLQGLLHWWVDKLLVGVHGGEPKAVFIGEVVAGPLGAVALNEGRWAEVLQAGTGRHQGLTATLSAGCCVLQRKDGQDFIVWFPQMRNHLNSNKTTKPGWIKHMCRHCQFRDLEPRRKCSQLV